MYCRRCGAPVPQNTSICALCGEPSVGAASTPPTDQAPYAEREEGSRRAEGSEPAIHEAQHDVSADPAGQIPFVPEPAPVVPRERSSSKKVRKYTIIGLATALVVLVGAGGFFGYRAYTEQQRINTYNDAVQLMDQGDYSAALDLFTALDDHEDSRRLAELCANTLAFYDAEEMFNSEDYANARAAFLELGSFMEADSYVEACDAWLVFGEAQRLTDEGSFEKASEKALGFSSVPSVNNSEKVQTWRNANNYGLAGNLLEKGEFYNAYTRFKALGAYKDAEARAQDCIRPLPGATEIYHHESFVSSSTDLVFDAGGSAYINYIKVYSGDVLVSAVLVKAGGSSTIQVPPGDYVFKHAWGDSWFGENDMFGLDGDYSVMIFDDGGETISIQGDKIYTITLFATEGGNVGNRTLDAGSF